MGEKMLDNQLSLILQPLLPAVKPTPPLLPLATNHLAFGSLCSWIPSPVVWGQQLPVSVSQSVFRAGTCATAQPSLLAPVPAQLFPPAADSTRFSQKAASPGMCQPASEPACRSVGQAHL